jgi:hypothetical protein
MHHIYYGCKWLNTIILYLYICVLYTYIYIYIENRMIAVPDVSIGLLFQSIA